MLPELMRASVKWGIGQDDIHLVMMTPKGVVAPPYPGSFSYSEGVVTWLDTMFCPTVPLPKRPRKLIEKGAGRIVVSFEAYDLFVEIDTFDGRQTKTAAYKYSDPETVLCSTGT